MADQKFHISFCIVCMNRLHQLKQTLLKNIEDNSDYENLEFILLDYNSQDGMADWVKDNFSEYIQTGRLIYYHTPEPQSFSHSHSKNIAFKLAQGNIVCNINADHYTGSGYANYINEQFKTDSNIVLTTIDYHRTQKGYSPSKDVFGKVCVKKSDFLRIHGFDESMKGYGFEDYDFVNRLEMMGVRREFIKDPSFLKFIAHPEEERYTLDEGRLNRVYINYQTPASSEIIFLFNDQTFQRGIVMDCSAINAIDYRYSYHPREQRFEYTISDPGLINGTWKEENGILYFKTISGDQTHYNLKNELLSNDINSLFFYRITDMESIQGLMIFNYFFDNRAIMEKSLAEKKVRVNENGFGCALIYRNLQPGHLIQN
jgi:GT2 family glycosyltransferase